MKNDGDDDDGFPFHHNLLPSQNLPGRLVLLSTSWLILVRRDWKRACHALLLILQQQQQIGFSLQEHTSNDYRVQVLLLHPNRYHTRLQQ